MLRAAIVAVFVLAGCGGSVAEPEADAEPDPDGGDAEPDPDGGDAEPDPTEPTPTPTPTEATPTPTPFGEMSAQQAWYRVADLLEQIADVAIANPSPRDVSGIDLTTYRQAGRLAGRMAGAMRSSRDAELLAARLQSITDGAFPPAADVLVLTLEKFAEGEHPRVVRIAAAWADALRLGVRGYR